MVRKIEESLVYAYPEFKLQSYIGAETLLHDLAVVRLRRGVGRVGILRIFMVYRCTSKSYLQVSA